MNNKITFRVDGTNNGWSQLRNTLKKGENFKCYITVYQKYNSKLNHDLTQKPVLGLDIVERQVQLWPF